MESRFSYRIKKYRTHDKNEGTIVSQMKGCCLVRKERVLTCPGALELSGFESRFSV